MKDVVRIVMPEDGPVAGLGTKVFLVDGDKEVPVHGIRSIRVNIVPDDAVSADMDILMGQSEFVAFCNLPRAVANGIMKFANELCGGAAFVGAVMRHLGDYKENVSEKRDGPVDVTTLDDNHRRYAPAQEAPS